jgi:DNA-binding Xre family transcriptional regulator
LAVKPSADIAELLAVDISARVDELSTQRHLSHRRLAKRAGLSLRAVQRVLKAAGSNVTTLVAVAVALDCDLRIEFVPKK